MPKRSAENSAENSAKPFKFKKFTFENPPSDQELENAKQAYRKFLTTDPPSKQIIKFHDYVSNLDTFWQQAERDKARSKAKSSIEESAKKKGPCMAEEGRVEFYEKQIDIEKKSKNPQTKRLDDLLKFLKNAKEKLSTCQTS